MNKVIAVCFVFILLFSLSGCGGDKSETDVPTSTKTSDTKIPARTSTPQNESKEQKSNNNTENTKTLVVYFSCTGTTMKIAEYAADILGADLYQITPEVPYTEQDLAYYTNGRADQEQNNPNARPTISDSIKNMDQYDTVLIGYPIWHGQAPRIISTFLESYDFAGKKLLPFCTSHSSGIGSSASDLHSICPKATWLDGERFSGSASKTEVEEWLNGLEITKVRNTKGNEFDFKTKTVKLNSGYDMPINGIASSSWRRGCKSLQGYGAGGCGWKSSFYWLIELVCEGVRRVLATNYD